MIYYVLFLGLFFTSFIDFIFPINTECQKKYQKVFLYFWVVVFFLVKSLRWDTGTDFAQFLACWQNSSWSNIFSYWRYGRGTELMEPGYVFLNVLIKSIIPSYTFFLIVSNLFIMYTFVKCICSYVVRFKLVAFAMLMVCSEMFPVRQTLATAFIVLAYMYMHNRLTKKYAVSMICAFLIHKSSVLMAPIYFIDRIRPNIKLFIVLYLFLCTIRQLLMTYLNDFFRAGMLSRVLGNTYRVNDLVGLEEFSYVTTCNTVAHFLLWAYIIKLLKKEGLDESNKKVYSFFLMTVNMYFIMVCLNVVGSIPGLEIVYRLCNNFWVVYPISVAISVWTLFYYKGKAIAVVCFLVLFSLKLYGNPCLDQDGPYYSQCFNPYYTVFQTDGEKLIRSSPWPWKN